VGLPSGAVGPTLRNLSAKRVGTPVVRSQSPGSRSASAQAPAFVGHLTSYFQNRSRDTRFGSSVDTVAPCHLLAQSRGNCGEGFVQARRPIFLIMRVTCRDVCHSSPQQTQMEIASAIDLGSAAAGCRKFLDTLRHQSRLKWVPEVRMRRGHDVGGA